MRHNSRNLFSSLTFHLRQTLVVLAGGIFCISASAASAADAEIQKAPQAEAAAAAEEPAAYRSHLADYVARAYKVPRDQIERIIDGAIEAGRRNNLDPLLILSITAAESAFNPNARNRSSGASGLMQVVPKVHASRFKKKSGGVFDIETNLQVGSELLRELIDRTGSLPRALKFYMGGALLSHDQGYGNKVTREHSRMKLAAQGDVSEAVSLHHSRRPAESFGDKISGTFTEFRNWLSEVTGG